MMGLPYGEESMIVSQTMWTQSTSVTDRWTDRRTDRITITKTVLRRASHGKNQVHVIVYVAVNSVGVDEERELQNFDSVRNVRITYHLTS